MTGMLMSQSPSNSLTVSGVHESKYTFQSVQYIQHSHSLTRVFTLCAAHFNAVTTDDNSSIVIIIVIIAIY